MRRGIWLLVLVLGLAYADAKPPRCMVSSLLRGLNYNLLPNGEDGLYFCSTSAPEQFRCSCSQGLTCKTLEDAWGRDIGQCTCCPPWMYGVIVIVAVAVLLCICSVLYARSWQGKWWMDGYPNPISMVRPAMRGGVPCPEGMSLPPNIFHGFDAQHFTDYRAEAGDNQQGPTVDGSAEPSDDAAVGRRVGSTEPFGNE